MSLRRSLDISNSGLVPDDLFPLIDLDTLTELEAGDLPRLGNLNILNSDANETETIYKKEPSLLNCVRFQQDHDGS
jgi:hypothetical protein